jgi:hypothetical protein
MHHARLHSNGLVAQVSQEPAASLGTGPDRSTPEAVSDARGYLPCFSCLASFLSFFSFAVSLGLFVFALRFLSWSLAMTRS